MSAKTFVGLASVASAVCIIGALAFVGYIVNDINDFYDNAKMELSDFKVHADSAWKNMIHSMKQHHT
ncbi:nematode cuticle collagen domain protein, partial [Oesophagostomum dentatum]